MSLATKVQIFQCICSLKRIRKFSMHLPCFSLLELNEFQFVGDSKKVLKGGCTLKNIIETQRGTFSTWTRIENTDNALATA